MEPLNPTAHQAGGGGILPGQVFGGQAADGPGAQGGEGVPLQQATGWPVSPWLSRTVP